MTEIDVRKLVLDAIQNKKPALLKELFETIPTIDIAEIMDDIEDVAQLMYVFRVVSADYTGDLFAELSSDQQEKIISSFSDKDLLKLLENSFTDDIVDSMEDLPANLVNRILRVAPKDLRKDINQLLNYKEGTAGSLLTTEFIEMRDSTTVEDAIATIRDIGKDAETIYTIFVKDARRTLVGTVDLDDLIFAQKEEILHDIMNRDFVTCNVNDDQEEVANMFKRYDLNAMAVVNNENKIIGIITIDDVVDVIEQEASEDIAALSHVAPLEESYLDTPVMKMVKKCIPWIVVLIILGTFTTMVLDRIEKADVFTIYAPVLIAFVPTLMDTGGNSGGQTIALMIRGLATQEFEPKDFFKVIRKEVVSALIIAACIAAFAFVWFTIEQYVGIVTNEAMMVDGIFPTIWNGKCWTSAFFGNAMKVSATVALALFAASFLSKIVAVCLPIGVAALKKDPAVIAQPLLTTIVDVVSLITFLGIAVIAFQVL